MNFNKFLIGAVISCLLIGAFPVWSYEMGSDSYRIWSSSINVGGDYQTSTNYMMRDTIGEIATDISTSTSYKLMAGYQQMQQVYISLSAPADVDLGTITGTGDTGLAISGHSATWVVTTDNPAGYKLEWQATSTNMTSGADIIGPYTPATPNTPEVWSVASTDSEWGARLSASSTDTDTATWGTMDEVEANAKWLNVSTAPYQVITRSSSNHPSGSNEKIWFRVEVGSNKIQPTGNYGVGVTITVTTL